MSTKSNTLYIIDGKVYDLKEWIPRHPGGSLWFARSKGRDISAPFHVYHPNIEKAVKVLK